MPDNNQKDISSKYSQQISTYQKTHPLRRLRFWLCVAGFIGGLVWALGFKSFGGSSLFFNTGPISKNHQAFADQCEKCHIGAETNMLAILPVSTAHQKFQQGGGAVYDSLKNLGGKALTATKESFQDPHKLADAMYSALGALTLDNIDRSCLVCHGGMSLHQPGMKAIMFKDTMKEIAIASAGACSTCHIEHVSSARMRLPGEETCLACHGNEKTLLASFSSVPNKEAKMAHAHSQNLVLKKEDKSLKGKGSREDYQENWPVQWIPAALEGHQPKVIRAFADADPALRHPDFLYQQKGSKDQAKLLFDHSKHIGPMGADGKRTAAKDIPANDILDCSSCHTTDADGIGMQRISYEQHCQRCHKLQIDPTYADLTVPHRSPEKVRLFLKGLRSKWVDFAREKYPAATPEQITAFRDNREKEFLAVWPGTADDWQKMIFSEGNPKVPTMPACIKCHSTQETPNGAKVSTLVVKAGESVPVVEDTAMPDQWLTRGPYKHAAHKDMACIKCHAQAESSSWTGDILLPPMSLCIECHRPRDYSKVKLDPVKDFAPTFGASGPEIVERQLHEGGVFDNCLRCHKYHVPAVEMELAKWFEKEAKEKSK